jgi:hypothetical protein
VKNELILEGAYITDNTIPYIPCYFISLFLYYIYSTLTVIWPFAILKHKSPEDFVKKARKNSFESNKDIIRGRLALTTVVVAEGPIKKRLTSPTQSPEIEVSDLRFVRNCLRDCLEAGTLVWVELSLHCICKGRLAGDVCADDILLEEPARGKEREKEERTWR